MKDRNRASGFPYDLPEKFGRIVAIMEEIPGVFYGSFVKDEEGLLPQEYYLVAEDAPAISAEAKRYGEEVADGLKMRAYNLEDPASGYQIIQYEISKYRLKQGKPVLKGDSLLSVSRRAMEYQPEYFGEYAAPMSTPWGQTTRYKKLTTGIFWIETEQIEKCLALCYPIWEGDLTERARKLGRVVGGEEITLEKSHGFVFYHFEESCVPLFELWQDLEALRGYINYPALMNAVWAYQPSFAIAWNARIQSFETEDSGLGRYQKREDLLRLTPDIGIEFIKI